MSTRLEYALSYAQAGYFLHPCKEDKRPHLTGWNEKASNDPQQVLAWGRQFPNCRWGVECGKSGLFILDSDNKDGKNDLALFQPSTGKWFIRNLQNGRSPIVNGLRWGNSGMVPVPGDYNGDGKYDLALYQKRFVQ